ncbi:MAG: ATP-binding protein, partial [Paracoccaceae bacterium]
MKIRAIKLTNVRRFAAKTAEISGIADGITVISAPNEQGKSTFFDALHAVFFQKHTGRPDEVTSLQPHAGGSPEVSVEIETRAGRFLIEKRFLAGKFAKVTDVVTGRLIAQADEAEAWLGRLVTSGGGPSGLLWVRQGALGLQPDKKPDQERMLDARRGLLSSVAGEVEAMTGGRRMDAILAATNAEIAALATTRGAKAEGPWGKVQKERTELEAELADLTAKCDRLRDELEERARVLQGLAVLQNP